MNTFGRHFRLTTFGESHGTAIGGIIDGCPAGIVFDQALLDSEMRRRHHGGHATARKEPDHVEILSGIHDGRTLGTPIGLLIHNQEQRSEDYDKLADCMRPGHADYTWMRRFVLRDHRGGGRASARETAVRVAAGAIAKMFLISKGISVHAELKVNHSPQDGVGFGGVIHCTVNGMPAGVGTPVFGKLNADLAFAMMSIPSAIGFEMGCGFDAAEMRGDEFRDAWLPGFATATNHCGGIQGGISNGMPIEFNVAFHPIVTIPGTTECVTSEGTIKTIEITGRHDTNHLPRTVVIVEAMAALTMADHLSDNS